MPERPDHYGIDIVSNDPSQPIYGVAVKNVYDGTVVIARESTSAGNYVVVKTNSVDPITGKNLYVRYLHMKDLPLVSENSSIATGTIIGYTGNTGEVYPEPTLENPTAGTHLHFDVNNNEKISGITAEEAVNPQKFFPSINFTGKTSNLN